MTILVTGATGFIGSHLINGEGFRALVRRPVGFESEFIGDLMDSRSLDIACKGVSTIYHCAGLSDTTSSKSHIVVNCQGTKNLLEAACRNDVKRFIFLSSVKAMANPGQFCVNEAWPGLPETSYGYSKKLAEAAVLKVGASTGMHVVNLRLAMVYGQRSRGNLWRLVEAMQRGWFPMPPETGNQRSLVHIDDVVRAMKLVAENPVANGKTYIVADQSAYSSREICDAIRSVVPSTISWSVPAWLLRLGGRVGDIACRLGCSSFPLNSAAVSRLLDSECYSSEKIKRDIGWKAEVGLVEGLRGMLLPHPGEKE